VVYLAATSGARAELNEEWTVRLPTGSTLYSGLRGMTVDAAGSTYVVGNAGVSYNVDTLTARYDRDGNLVWSHVYNGPGNWHDTINGVALAPDGSVLAVGSTPGAGRYADLLVLKYDGDGNLLWDRAFNGGPFASDGGLCVAVDRDGNVYAGGHTVGDGSDCLVVKFDPDGRTLWSKTWDGPAPAPYSQEAVRGIAVAPDGDIVIIADGVMPSLHPDYVVIKYAAADGAVRWISTWGESSGDTPVDLAIDAQGDIYVTGTTLKSGIVYGTVKFDGSDGRVLWAEYDATGFRDAPHAIALDGRGGVYVTGSTDPFGDDSKFMHNMYTVKRNTETGAQLWTNEYGATCVGCYDVPGDLIVDLSGHAHVVGTTSSPPYTLDQLLLVLDAESGVEVETGIVESGINDSAAAGFVALDGAGNVHVGGNYEQLNTGEVDILAVKYASLGGVECERIRKFSVRCTGGKLTAVVKSTLSEGTQLTVDNGGDIKPMTINARGKGKVKYTGQSGRRTLSILECPEFRREVSCR